MRVESVRLWAVQSVPGHWAHIHTFCLLVRVRLCSLNLLLAITISCMHSPFSIHSFSIHLQAAHINFYVSHRAVKIADPCSKREKSVGPPFRVAAAALLLHLGARSEWPFTLFLISKWECRLAETTFWSAVPADRLHLSRALGWKWQQQRN